MKSCEVQPQKMRTSNIEHPTSNIQHRSEEAIFRHFDVRCWTLDVRLHFLLLCSLLQACCPPPPQPHPSYDGPTESMDVVTQAINANASRIPSLWTQLNFNATFINADTKAADAVAGDGVLMYSRDISLLMNGDKDVAGQVFQLGSNDEEFWVRLRTGADTHNYWFGHYANLDKAGSKPVPIRPDLVIEVLGIGMYRSNFLQLPVPIMRFDNDADAYVFDINQPEGDRWETREEIWYDRATKNPLKVILYGHDGRAVLRAELSQHTGVQIPGVPREQWPRIARHFDLYFPESKTRISLDLLNDPELHHAGRGTTLLPNKNSFVRPEPEDGDKVIPVD